MTAPHHRHDETVAEPHPEPSEDRPDLTEPHPDPTKDRPDATDDVGRADDPAGEAVSQDERVLAFEADWQAGRLRGDKETLIRERLGMSSPRYHHRLNLLIDDPGANLDHPVLLARLGRIRQQRREARSARGLRR